MREIARRRWFALWAGVLLLAGSPAFDQAVLLAEPAPVEPEVALHQWAMSRLSESNRRLPSATRARIADAVLRCGRDQALPPDLVLAVLIVESSARPHAYSPKGAIGLMQVMPYMFERLDLPGSAGHLETNIEAGCLLLADNIRRLGESDGVSSYFWGSSIRGDGYLRRVTRVRRGLGLELAQSLDGSRGQERGHG